MVKNSNFTFLLLELILADQVADLFTPWYWHLVVKNGNFTFLLLELILVDQVANLPPGYWHLVVKNAYWQIKWQIYWQIISTPWYWHLVVKEWQFHLLLELVGRSSGRSTPQYWSSGGNFTFLLLELILADLLADLPPPSVVASSGQEWSNFTFLLLELILADQVADLPFWNWHLVVKNGNFTFLLLELILADQVADLPPGTGI